MLGEPAECQARLFHKPYLELVRRIYAGDRNLRTTSVALARSLLDQANPFAARSIVRPILIRGSDGRAQAAAILVRPPGTTFVTISFFEAAREVTDAAAKILAQARDFARETGATSIIAGLNGHVSLGVGYLLDNFDALPAFDTPYNPPSYPRAWRSLDPTSVHEFHSYRYEPGAIAAPPRAIARASRYFTVRKADLWNWDREITILTRILNESAAEMPLYFPKEPAENIALMGGLKFLLKPEHLLFLIDKSGREAGFLFWHPDFNEALAPGQGHSALDLLLAAQFRKRRITRFIVNTLAVRPDVRGMGGIFLLVDSALRANPYLRGESAFIARNNRLSTALGENVNGILYKRFDAYEYEAIAS